MKNKTMAQKLGLIVALILLAADIVFIITDIGDRTFSYITFFAAIGGSALLLLHFILNTKLDFLPLIAAAFLGTALGMHLFLGFPTLSDIWNGVNFVGGNSNAVITFGAIFSVGTIASVILSFMKQRDE